MAKRKIQLLKNKGKNRKAIGFCLFLLLITIEAFAASQGHYYPGVISLRDSVMPPPGHYAALYDVYYHAGRYKDSQGDDFKGISSTGSISRDISLLNHPIRVTLDATANVDVDLKVDNIGHQLMYIWAPEKKILKAHYAALIAPYFGYQRVRIDAAASIDGVLHVGQNLSVPVQASRSKKIIDNKYGFGDLYVRPLWLQWSGAYYDTGVNYGCYIPVGAYDKDDIANIGMGFFTNQFQHALALYPVKSKAAAFILNTTYEINTKKYDADIHPGSDLTFEYGISQYLSQRFEMGASGYSQMQVSDDGGWAAANKTKHRQINGVGGEINYWIVSGKLMAALRYSYEYGGKSTFQGHNGSLNFVYKWGKPIES